MDWIPDDHRGPSAVRRSLSRASTATSTTLLVHTPSSSDASSGSPGHARRLMPTAAPPPPGPLRVTSVSVTDWRPQYPRIGQFAMTSSEEVIAATPNGLVYFKRVQDHPSKPWSEPRPFPPTAAALNASTVTGLALRQGEKGALHVYCAAAGRLHAFSRSEDSSSSFVVEPCPPFADSMVSGTPAVTSIKEGYDDSREWCIIVPCPSGGILYTSTIFLNGASYGPRGQGWEPTNQLAAHLGIISAVSVAMIYATKRGSSGMTSDDTTDIVAVCIASSRLYSIEGPFQKPSYSRKNSWQAPKSIRIQHPGEVTGNPVLLSSRIYTGDYQLDLLVPSVEGGVFHFIRTVKTPDEWHMIGRINFPTGIPIASSLACERVREDSSAQRVIFRAFVQCGGRLYVIETAESALPWVGSQLYPINGPGPFLH